MNLGNENGEGKRGRGRGRGTRMEAATICGREEEREEVRTMT